MASLFKATLGDGRYTLNRVKCFNMANYTNQDGEVFDIYITKKDFPIHTKVELRQAHIVEIIEILLEDNINYFVMEKRPKSNLFITLYDRWLNAGINLKKNLESTVSNPVLRERFLKSIEFVKSNPCFGEDEARWYFQQIILAMDFARRMNVKLNVKLDSMFFDSKTIQPLIQIMPYLCLDNIDDVTMAGNVLKDILMFIVPVYMFTSIKFISILVTEECVDLLNKICISTPCISFEDIMKHPWFLKDLPEGALQMNDNQLNENNII